MQTTKLSIAFPEVGVIRKGAEKADNGVVGKDLNDRFRVVFYPGAGEIAAAFFAAYDTYQPHTIRAMAPFRSVWDAWSNYNEAYNAGRMIAQADDEHYIVLRDPLTGEYQVRNGEPHRPYTPGEGIAYERNGKRIVLKLKPTGRLRLFLPELGRMVTLTLKTTSYYDRLNVQGHLGAIQAIAEALNGGNAAGIPLVIYRAEREVTWNKPDGGALRVKKWLVNIEADAEWVKAATQRLSRFALTGEMPVGLLQPVDELVVGAVDPAADDEDEVEDAPDELIVEAQAKAGNPDSAPVMTGNAQLPTDAAQPRPDVPLRPLPAEKVREFIHLRAEKKYANATASPEQRGLLRHALELCFAGDPDVEHKRHTVTFYLAGRESTANIPASYVQAMLAWLDPQKSTDGSGEYAISPDAAREAHACYTAALIAEGQMSLPATSGEVPDVVTFFERR